MAKDIALNIYDLSRSWFDFCFSNPEKISPNHTALLFFAIEHCNRLGWKPKFGLPTLMAKEAIGIKSYTTYSKTLTDLVVWGFIIMVETSKNQYSSNIVALSKNMKAHGKALDKAMIKHVSKQVESTCESIDSIDKQIYNNTSIQVYREFAHLKITFKEFEILKSEGWTKEQIDAILDDIENYSKNKKYKVLRTTARKWLKRDHVPGKTEVLLTANQFVKDLYPDD
jgi:5-bromo-4-chloroindolyl phosphate hydrolysis protein